MSGSATEPGSASVSYTVLADESGVQERYLGFGAILLPTKHVKRVESELEAYCDRRGMGARELGWKKCSATDVDRYCEFVEHFWRFNQSGVPIDFRAMMVDTEKHPLRHPGSGANTREMGFYRFYYSFLSRSVRIVAPDASRVRFYVAPLTDQYEFRTEILEKTVLGHLRAELEADTTVEVVREAPKLRRLHQLADILLGAVTYKFNERDPELESPKAQLYLTIEGRVGKPLDQDFFPSERPFNVWGWVAPGGRRWVSGAAGRA